MKILPASWILNKSLKGWPLTYSDSPPPQFKTFQVSHLKANFSEKHQHPISNLPVCSPTLTVELGLLWNPEYESIPPTKQGTISCLVFGKSFNIACYLRGMKQMNCLPSLAESTSTPKLPTSFYLQPDLQQ